MQVGILGGGTIGGGWAELLRAHGHEVRVFDCRPERCAGAETVAEAVTGAELVIEAVVEREEEKRSVLAEAAGHAPVSALLASSSSSILPSRLQEGVPHPDRLLVLHPLHPVTLMPVVEVVPGAATSAAAVNRARTLLLSLGKVAVVLKREVPGYVVNRLAAALWREALDLVLRGVADPAEVDSAASLGPCLGWAVQGPFLTYQLAAPGGIGPFMAHLHPAFASIWRSLSTWDQLSPDQLEQVVAATEQAYGRLDRAAMEAERDQALQRLLGVLRHPEGGLV